MLLRQVRTHQIQQTASEYIYFFLPAEKYQFLTKFNYAEIAKQALLNAGAIAPAFNDIMETRCRLICINFSKEGNFDENRTVGKSG